MAVPGRISAGRAGPAESAWLQVLETNSAVVRFYEEAAGKRTPNQDTDVVILGERLELIFKASADEAVIHLRRNEFLQSHARLQHHRGGRLP